MGSSGGDQKPRIYGAVQSRLLKFAFPDSRFHYDFSRFIPDFQGSSEAIDRLRELPCYKLANTVYIAPDNSLEQLRFCALKDGKKVLVGTFGLRRGFVLLDPRRIPVEKYELASCLDTMERSGSGRHVSLHKMNEEELQVDMYVVGSLAVTEKGMQLWEGHETPRFEWHILNDRKILNPNASLVTVVHSCQVVRESDDEREVQDSCGPQDMRCHFLVTPEEAITIEGVKHDVPSPLWLDNVDDSVVQSVQPLQELKGIKMMEQIMKAGGILQEEQKVVPTVVGEDEQMGIDIVERIMKGYRA